MYTHISGRLPFFTIWEVCVIYKDQSALLSYIKYPPTLLCKISRRLFLHYSPQTKSTKCNPMYTHRKDQNMTIYYITIIMLTGMGYIIEKMKKDSRQTIYYLSAAFAVFNFIASFRYAIGFDYFSYRDLYNLMSSMSFSEILQNYWYEPLYFIMSKLFALLGCTFPVFLIFINAFLIFVTMRFIYYESKLPWMSVYLYITLQFLAYNMNLIRQSIGVAFFLLTYPHLKARKPIPFLIYTLIGGLFHNSLLFVFPLYFLLPKKHSWKILLGIVMLAVFAYFSFDYLFAHMQPYLPDKYAEYTITYYWNSSTFIYVVPCVIYGLLLYLFRGQIQDTCSRNIYLNSAFYNLLISIFITKHFILERFAVYPFVLSLIAIPDLISSAQNTCCEIRSSTQINDMNSRIHSISSQHILIIFLLFGSAYFFFAVSKGFHNVYPYVSLLDKIKAVPVQTL